MPTLWIQDGGVHSKIYGRSIDLPYGLGSSPVLDVSPRTEVTPPIVRRIYGGVVRTRWLG